MTDFGADFTDWTAKQKANIRQILLGATEDVFELMTRRQPSVKETAGAYREGFVPVDQGVLIGSARLEINGRLAATGTKGKPPDFTTSLEGAKTGEYIEAFFTAAYARRIEYGFSGTDKAGRTYNQKGRYYVRNAVMQWRTIVEQNARFIGGG